MITDHQTNKLFLADSIIEKQPIFFDRFKKVLDANRIDFELLPNTLDIWAVDFMPVQVSKNEFIQFTYNPDYLKEKNYQKSISDVDAICKAINLNPIKSDIVLGGGNVIRSANTVIMCDKVFHENKHISEQDLINHLKELLHVDNLFFVPWDKDDYTGHADGMVRFIDEKTVLINKYFKENEAYERSFRMALHNAGLSWVELPYNPPNDPTYTSARGVYLNYLHMEQAIIVPTFNTAYDEKALKVLEETFPFQTIITMDSIEIADEGGILNCISWNIQA